MTIFLTVVSAVRSFFARLPKEAWWILGAVVLAVIVWRIGYGAGKDAQRARMLPQIERLAAGLDTCRASVGVLEDALARQSAAISEARAMAEARRLEAADAEKRAAQAERQSAAVKRRLEEQARLASHKTGTAMTQDEREAWEMLR